MNTLWPKATVGIAVILPPLLLGLVAHTSDRTASTVGVPLRLGVPPGLFLATLLCAVVTPLLYRRSPKTWIVLVSTVTTGAALAVYVGGRASILHLHLSESMSSLINKAFRAMLLGWSLITTPDKPKALDIVLDVIVTAPMMMFLVVVSRSPTLRPRVTRPTVPVEMCAVNGQGFQAVMIQWRVVPNHGCDTPSATPVADPLCPQRPGGDHENIGGASSPSRRESAIWDKGPVISFHPKDTMCQITDNMKA